MEAEFSDLLGKTLVDVDVYRGGDDDDHITFVCSDGSVYVMRHKQDCCENVWIEDINGDFNDLLNQPILLAEEVTNKDEPPSVAEWRTSDWESYTWTFYKLATNRGFVNLRWFGESTGDYSEEVDFVKVN